MPVNDVADKRNKLIASAGRATLHAQFPNDFEYYAMNLELVDSNDTLISSLTFPVMPNNITESHVSNSTQTKTSNGVVSLYDPSFVPFDINISGSFGRKFTIITMVDDTKVTVPIMKNAKFKEWWGREIF